MVLQEIRLAPVGVGFFVVWEINNPFAYIRLSVYTLYKDYHHITWTKVTYPVVFAVYLSIFEQSI